MLKEFKEFAMKGNMIDMAVGIIIGAAFGTIIASLVADVMTPFFSLAMDGIDFANMHAVLQQGEPAGPYKSLEEATKAGAIFVGYGKFINSLISFLLVAFTLFIVIKQVNKMKKAEEAAPEAPAEPPKQEVLLEEIRDLLKKSA